MQRKFMFRTILTVAALFIAIQMGQTGNHIGISQVHAEKPNLSFGVGNPGIQTPVVQPAWSVKVDNWTEYYTSNSTVTGEGKIFTLKDQKLIALNAQTGKIIWTSKDNVQPTFVYHEGNIYGVSSDWSLYALSASNGKKLWKSSVQIEKPNYIHVFGDTLYVLVNNYTFAVNVKTGKKLWENVEPLAVEYGSSGLIDAGEAVLRTFSVYEGPNSYNQLNAIDKKTGKKLWGISNQYMPLKIEGGLAYSIKNNQPKDESAERSITVSLINVKSGAIKGSRVYRWSVDEGRGNDYLNDGTTHLDGNDFYIHQNGILARYDFKNYKLDGFPLQSYSDPANDPNIYPLNVVHRGRILFSNQQNGSLTSIKRVNGQHMSWSGDNPPAMTTIYGKAIYLAQTDGTLHAIDFDSGKLLFQVKTGARQYDTTLKEDGFLIIQTPGKLTGVKLPAALK